MILPPGLKIYFRPHVTSIVESAEPQKFLCPCPYTTCANWHQNQFIRFRKYHVYKFGNRRTDGRTNILGHKNSSVECCFDNLYRRPHFIVVRTELKLPVQKTTRSISITTTTATTPTSTMSYPTLTSTPHATLRGILDDNLICYITYTKYHSHTVIIAHLLGVVLFSWLPHASDKAIIFCI